LCSLRVEDVSEANVDDVFKVCSHNRLDDPVQRQGIGLKRSWLLDMLSQHGPMTKIAYLDDRPVAQLLFYPEEVVPFIADPRKDVINIHCVYNPFLETRGKGAGFALMRSLMEDGRRGLRCLGGRPCRFIVAKPFNSGEGVSLSDFYKASGFKESSDEMFLEISATYRSRAKKEYVPLPEDRRRAIVFYNPLCEYSYPFATKVKELLKEIKPSLLIELIDEWRHPSESVKRGNHWLIANSTPIKSFWTQGEEFRREVELALGN